MNILGPYRQLVAEWNFDEEEKVYYGRISYIFDLVTFSCHHKKDLRKEFEMAVDDYLDNGNK